MYPLLSWRGRPPSRSRPHEDRLSRGFFAGTNVVHYPQGGGGRPRGGGGRQSPPGASRQSFHFDMGPDGTQTKNILIPQLEGSCPAVILILGVADRTFIFSPPQPDRNGTR